MGFFKRRSRVTAEQLGFHLGTAAVLSATKGDDGLGHLLLQRSPFSPVDQVEFWTEVLIVNAFPLDLILAGEQPSHPAARAAMREVLRTYVNSMRTDAKLEAVSVEHWEKQVGSRFESYASALRRAEKEASSGGSASGGMSEFGFSAYQNCFSRTEGGLEAAMVIVLRYTSIMKHMREVIRSYEVVGS